MNSPVQSLRQLAHKLAALEPSDPIRLSHEKLLLDKLNNMGILPLGATATLSSVEKQVTVAAFARRRLPVVVIQTSSPFQF